MLSSPGSWAPFRDLRRDLDHAARWPVLDGVRGAALVGVIAYHFYRLLYYGEGASSIEPSPFWAWPFGLGKFTIDVFFVLSGLLIVQSWRSTRGRKPLGSALKDFWIKRCRRILPVWWVSLAVLIPLYTRDFFEHAGLFELGALATMQQYLVPGLVGKVNVVSWSLTTELHFYLAVPLVAWAIDRFGGPLVLAGSVVLSVAWWHGSLVEQPTSLLPGRLDQFVVGALAGSAVVAHERGVSSWVVRFARRRFVPVVSVAVLAGLGLHTGATLGRPQLIGWVSHLAHPVVGLVVALLFVRWLTHEQPASLTGTGFRALGLVSYSAYLWHYPMLFAFLSAAGLMGAVASDPVGGVAGATVIAVAIAGVAVASYGLLERPFLRTRRRPRTETRPGPDAPTRTSGEDQTGPRTTVTQPSSITRRSSVRSG